MNTLQLFKNLPFDNASNMPIFSSLTNQNDYMNNHADYTGSVDFNKIGDPIILSMSYDIAIDYSYGRVQFNNIWIYFSITDVSVNENNRTVFSYQIDAWNTGRYQKSFSLGRTQISRRKITNGKIPMQPIQPIDMTISNINEIFQNKTVFFVLSQIKITKSEYSSGPWFCCSSGVLTEGQWYHPFTNEGYFTVSDIVGAWIVPISYSSVNWLSLSVTDSEDEMKYTNQSATISSGHSTDLMPSGSLSFPTIYSDDLHKGGFSDINGNILYIVPHGRSISSLSYYLRMSAVACQINIRFNNNTYDSISNEGFTFACYPMDVIIDSWADYCARYRDYEKQNRSLQNTQSLIGGATSGLAMGVMSGAIAGSMVAPGIGTLAGAALGGMTSGISSLISAGVTNYYEPRIQQNEDKKYQLEQDTLSLSGGYVTDVLVLSAGMFTFELLADQYTIDRYNNEISNNGHYVNETISNGETMIIEQPLQCNPEILGNLPTNWKQQIVNRFMNGVKLKVIQ
jgi:hypothetical protein